MTVADAQRAQGRAHAAAGDLGPAPAGLAPSLLAALESVTVAGDCASATVGGRSVRADSTAEFTRRLGRAIYQVLHVGWAAEPGDLVRTRRDEDLEARLGAATPHKSVMRTARLLSADLSGVHFEIEGVKVVIPRADADVAAGQHGPSSGRVAVRLPSVRPALSPGYFLADGRRALDGRGRILRVYVHLQTAAALVTAWQVVLAVLEERGVAFRAKVTSVPALLPRRDALVVYLDDGDEAAGALAAAGVLAAAVGGIPGVGAAVSAFTEQVGHGVAIAWEPGDRRPQTIGLSFGEHRAYATAEGLLRHAGAPRRGSKAEAVRLAMIEAGINPACPARNLT